MTKRELISDFFRERKKKLLNTIIEEEFGFYELELIRQKLKEEERFINSMISSYRKEHYE